MAKRLRTLADFGRSSSSILIDRFDHAAEEDFYSRVEKQPGEGCWNWIGTLKPDGYGVYRRGGETCAAHQFAMTLAGREAVPGTRIKQTCGNRACVRHLELVMRVGPTTTRQHVTGRYLRAFMAVLGWDRERTAYYVGVEPPQVDRYLADLDTIPLREKRRLHAALLIHRDKGEERAFEKQIAKQDFQVKFRGTYFVPDSGGDDPRFAWDTAWEDE